MAMYNPMPLNGGQTPNIQNTMMRALGQHQMPMVNHAGPASIQQLAQNAAQNVLRRQRMKAMLGKASSAAGAGGPLDIGGGRRISGSFVNHPNGSQGGFRLPYQTLQSLQQAAQQYGNGGMFGPGGGGADFGSLPDPQDPYQSPGSLNPPQAQPAPSIGDAIGPTPPQSGVDAVNQIVPNGAQGTNLPVDNGGQAGPNGATGWVPLGGGLFYDPTNDIVRGGNSAAPANGLNPIDKRF